MSGFSNAIVGGMSKLIRAAIQSPNYVPATDGWIISADGSAEFNDAIIRGEITAANIILVGGDGEILVYSGTPAAGNLVAAISAVAGTDEFGNVYGAGYNVYGLGAEGSLQLGSTPTVDWRINNQIGATDNGMFLLSARSALTDGNRTQLELSYNMVTKHSGFNGYADEWIFHNATNVIAQNIYGGFKFSQGLEGWYDTEIATTDVSAGQSIPNAVTTQITNWISSRYDSDYGTGFNTFPDYANSWYAPVASYYDITMNTIYDTQFSSRAVSQIRKNGTMVLAAQDTTFSNGNTQNVSGTFYLDAGDRVSFWVYQNSGSARKLAEGNPNQVTNVAIARRL